MSYFILYTCTITSSLTRRSIQSLPKTFPNLAILAKSVTGRFKCEMVTTIKWVHANMFEFLFGEGGGSWKVSNLCSMPVALFYYNVP